MNSDYLFMAFAGRENTDNVEFKKVWGIGQFNIIGVCPTKEELSKLYGGAEIKSEPVYLGEKDGIPWVRIDFIIKATPELNPGITSDLITKISYFLRREARYSNDKSKAVVINKYGESTFLPIENIKNNTVPEKLSWFDSSYRLAVNGEPELTSFLKAYLNIPNKSYVKDGQTINIENLTNAEALIDNIDALFKGNFKDIKVAINAFPNNRVQLAKGVKTVEGKQYDDFFNAMPLKASVKTYSNLEQAITESKSFGGYSSTEFFMGPLCEYNPTPSKLEDNKKDEESANALPDFLKG